MTRRRSAEYTQEAPQVNAGNPRFRAEKPEDRLRNRRVAPAKSPPYKRCPGEVPEWSIGTVSKTVVRASVPWVRIPPSPPFCFALRATQGEPSEAAARSRVPSEALAKEGGPKDVLRLSPSSDDYPDQRYIGLTTDLKQRFTEHNAGKSAHTSKFKPWRLVTYVAFSDQSKATAFERYLKSGSGHAFARKRLW